LRAICSKRAFSLAVTAVTGLAEAVDGRAKTAGTAERAERILCAVRERVESLGSWWRTETDVRYSVPSIR
jgi:hypothetical protein